METQYDRTTEDIGNIIGLEHVNTTVPDQRLATIFYITGMGFTRDPYFSTGVGNMWINVGRSQFHMPTAPPQVLRGHVGLVLPSRERLLERLTQVKADLDGTHFGYSEHDHFVEVTSPWGNHLRCFEPDPVAFGRIDLGMPYVEFDVPVGTADAIARFYREVFATAAKVDEDRNGRFAACSVGHRQELIFRETDRTLPPYDGHHLQIYLANFSGPHAKLVERDLVFEESASWQYRFRDIVDLDSGEVVSPSSTRSGA